MQSNAGQPGVLPAANQLLSSVTANHRLTGMFWAVMHL